jgi:nickel/cobalt transporter (NicO) family protein
VSISLFHIILSSVVLSIIHASIPNHWLPLVAIGKAEKWNRNRTLLATAISGFAHIASTILIGVFVGWAGYRLSESYHTISLYVAPGILVLLGFGYIIRSFFRPGHHHHFGEDPKPNTPFTTVVLSLSIGMFFSPCIELESFYFTAGTWGWMGIIIVSVIYLVCTVSAMLAYVAIALEGIRHFNIQFLEKNEKLIIGLALTVIGIATYFFNLH